MPGAWLFSRGNSFWRRQTLKSWFMWIVPTTLLWHIWCFRWNQKCQWVGIDDNRIWKVQWVHRECKLNMAQIWQVPNFCWNLFTGWRMKPDRNVEKADVLVNHAVYNITMVEKYIKPGYKLIVPVREPVSWFKSSVNYRNNVSCLKLSHLCYN